MKVSTQTLLWCPGSQLWALAVALELGWMQQDLPQRGLRPLSPERELLPQVCQHESVPFAPAWSVSDWEFVFLRAHQRCGAAATPSSKNLEDRAGYVAI